MLSFLLFIGNIHTISIKSKNKVQKYSDRNQSIKNTIFSGDYCVWEYSGKSTKTTEKNYNWTNCSV